MLARYRRTDPAVPVGVVLIIADPPEREEDLLADLVARPVRAPVAISSKDPLWRVPGAEATAGR